MRVVWCIHNCLPDKYILKWADLNGSCRDNNARLDLVNLIEKSKNNNIFKAKQWAWNINAQRCTYLNGNNKF